METNTEEALESLTKSLLGTAPDNTSILLQKRAKAIFRATSTNATNQFAVRDRFSGLEERWRVISEDECADSLERRIRRLHDLNDQDRYQYVPECLQLLLSLATGAPNVRFEAALAAARTPVPDPNKAVDSKVDYDSDPEIWKIIDYAEDDSDLESEYVSSSQVAADAEDQSDSELSSQNIDQTDAFHVETIDRGTGFGDVVHTRKALEDLNRGSRLKITEATVIRETIHMLHGLPTTLFLIGPSNHVRVAKTPGINAVSSAATETILNHLAVLGSLLVPLRAWTQRDEQTPTMVRFQAVTNALFKDFLSKLQAAERQLMSQIEGALTLSALLKLLDTESKPLVFLSKCLPVVKGHDRDVRLLNNLCMCIVEQEALGLQAEQMVLAFVECFKTYWRPVESWLQGDNITCAGITFVHAANEKDLPLDGLWRGLFDFTYNDKGYFQAPEFLKPFLSQLMTVGKTAYMLNKLQQREALSCNKIAGNWMQSLSLRNRHTLEPFESSLERAVQERLRLSKGLSQALLTHLRDDWKLRYTIKDIELVYLNRLGSVADRAHTALFRLVDRSDHQEWQDHHVLTGLFQDAYAGAVHSTIHNLTASHVPTASSSASRSRSIIQLEAIRINLALPWPLANIIDAGATTILQRVAIVLMQVGRAKYMLDECTLQFNPNGIRDVAVRRGTIGLHQRLRWFVNTLHSYLVFDVLAKADSGLSAASSEASDLDMAIQSFRTGVELLERGCFLSEGLISSHQAVTSILDLAVMLSDLCLQRHLQSGHAEAEAHGNSNSSDDEESSSQRLSTMPDRQGSEDEVELDSVQLKRLAATFHQLLTFVQAGLREAGRMESDRRLELFADDLALELKALKWSG